MVWCGGRRVVWGLGYFSTQFASLSTKIRGLSEDVVFRLQRLSGAPSLVLDQAFQAAHDSFQRKVTGLFDNGTLDSNAELQRRPGNLCGSLKRVAF